MDSRSRPPRTKRPALLRFAALPLTSTLSLALALALCLMGLTACDAAAPEPTPQPASAVTVFPSRTPAATPAPTATATPISAPTLTLMPAASPTPSRPDTLLLSMTLEQKVGQVMAIGFGANALVPAVKKLLNDLHIGGIVIFDRNVESPLQLAQLIRDAQETTLANGDLPLFVAIDQEGGPVARLRAPKGFTEFPSPMAVAATGDVNNARRVALAMAQELRALGINMNLAPVLDVNNNAANPIIGIRSYSSDPATVSAFGNATIEALQGAGIACVAKHFPGHGDTSVDSHLGLPQILHTRTRLDSIELAPFKAAIQSQVAGIMSAHIHFPAVDDTPNLPASLSSKVQVNLLRDELKFDGLTLSDSLEMGALEAAGFTTAKSAALALAAGTDLLTFNSTLDVYRETHALIVTQVQSGVIPQARLDEAVRRVLRTKEHFGVLDTAHELADVAAVPTQVGLPEANQLAIQIGAQAITLVRDKAQQLPLKAEAALLVIETPFALGLGNTLGAPALPITERPTAVAIENAVALAQGKTVVVATYEVAKNPAQAELVNALLHAGIPVVVVATRSPYDAMLLPDAPTVVALYGMPLFQTLANALRGAAPMPGVLPVKLS